MFNLELYKHPSHKERRAITLSLEELCMKLPEERTLPYYSISVEQLEADEAYQRLNGADQGDFMRLLHLLWRSNGLLPDYSKGIASSLGFTEEGWNAKRNRFIDCGLLEISPDTCHILNRGLRQQYLNTLDDCNAKRNGKRRRAHPISLSKPEAKKDIDDDLPY